MGLPKLETPVYELELPSTGEKISYRPFLVKEEKILMLAMEDDDANMTTAIKNIIKNCTFGKVDVEQIAPFDVDWIILQHRNKSKGETSNIQLKCVNDVNGKECGTINKIALDLTKVKVKKSDDVKSLIKLNDDIGVELKYPNYEIIEKLEGTESETDYIFKLIANCIASIYDGDKVFYPIDDFNQTQAVEFLEQLTETQFKEIREFFDNIPKVSHTFEFQCEKCGHKDEITLEGLDNFLD